MPAHIAQLSIGLTVQIMLAHLFLTQHWFGLNFQVMPNHIIYKISLNISLIIQLTPTMPNSAMHINLLWFRSSLSWPATQQSDISYVCPDSTCHVRIINVSKNESQFHVPCTDVLKPCSCTVVLVPDIQWKTLDHNLMSLNNVLSFES